MKLRAIDAAFVGRLAAFGFILAVAGCQSGGSAGRILNIGKAAPVDVAAEQAKIDAAELRAYCPRVQLPTNTAIINRYEKNAEGDASKLIYQASIADVTRACSSDGGTMTINVAVAGRVVPGPLGGGQTVTVPIKIEVVQADGAVLYAQVHQYQVQTQPGAGATQFVFSDPAIVIPQPNVRNVRVFAGYDVPAPPKPDVEL